MADAPDWSPLPRPRAGARVGEEPARSWLDRLPSLPEPNVVAGALILGNLALWLLQVSLDGSGNGGITRLVTVGVGFDLLIGAGLFVDDPRLRVAAMFGAGLGLATSVALAFMSGHWGHALLPALWVAGLANLFVGSPPPRRMWLSILGFGAYALAALMYLAAGLAFRS